MNLSSTINRAALLQFEELQMEGAPDILVEIIDSFLNTSPERLELIAKSIEEHDFKAAANKAHAMKSGAKVLGGDEVERLCQEIENLRDSQDLEKLKKIFACLQESYQIMSKELREIKNERVAKK